MLSMLVGLIHSMCSRRRGSLHRLSTSLGWDKGRVGRSAIAAHGNNVRMLFSDALSPEEASAIRVWSERTIEALMPAS